ncbi:glucosaminidase domain-containing protein [Sulfurivermis fontis]|uniref:glucosaminidase domain-containing protein n=1 Tax=Sulfurivermis fontis TaxID=1972068 RepID=UPI000FDBD00D|nr:glucosaminidase domain-containing protein [Sulfurivermis fontis]
MMHWLRWLVRFKLLLLAAAAPLLLAAILYWFLVRPYVAGVPAPIPLPELEVASAEHMETLFAGYNYHWPPQGPLPRIAIVRFPDDIGRVEVTRKKALFFRGLLPLVEAENAHIRAQRRYIEERFALGPLRPGTRNWNQVEKLAELYRVPGDLNDPVVREILLRRVDEVPAALVLAQAANESAWGTSRFAREANNLFGLWTYKKDLGMVPAQRMEGARHYVRVFPDLRSSVRVYLFNLNIGHAYVDMRRARAALRLAGAAFDAEHLAAGLLRYSERGAEYVAEIQRMIRSNGLGQLGPLQLAPEEP